MWLCANGKFRKRSRLARNCGSGKCPGNAIFCRLESCLVRSLQAHSLRQQSVSFFFQNIERHIFPQIFSQRRETLRFISNLLFKKRSFSRRLFSCCFTRLKKHSCYTQTLKHRKILGDPLKTSWKLVVVVKYFFVYLTQREEKIKVTTQ